MDNSDAIACGIPNNIGESAHDGRASGSNCTNVCGIPTIHVPRRRHGAANSSAIPTGLRRGTNESSLGMERGSDIGGVR